MEPRSVFLPQLNDLTFIDELVPRISQHVRVDPLVGGTTVRDLLFQSSPNRDAVTAEHPHQPPTR